MDRGQSQGKRKRAEEESIEGASTSSSISPESIDACNGQYDVFLSFRGLDTRKAFTDHLYHSLIKAGMVRICVFKDDKSIPIGEEFGSQILDAITRSKISIPIISKNYASSKWCLRELTHIMDCKKRTSHMVLPIFYKVEPSDVRYLKGSFGEAFHSHKNRFDKEEIQEVERALREVSNLHGWESEKFANGHEGELVEKVVENILSKLRQDFQLDVTKYLVGIGDHVNKIRKWIDSPTGVARMIGIYGMGGIGKTTLAKAIYNQLSNDFMHRSFLANIRETAHHNNMPYLQKQLIEDIQEGECSVGNVDKGISLIKSTFKQKKVLLLLDDIDNKNQLDVLARERDWFVPGSMIIVTTRNEAVLDQSEFEVDYKYELNGLDKVHALLLFNRHAFRMDHSPKDFDGISRDIISTMGGLPLALEVVGSYLYKKENKGVWEDVRKKLKNQLNKDVQKILQISYDALEEGHKQIFLDIVCFFIGKESRFAMYMWEDCGLCPSQGIEELKLRCLIKIGYWGEFEMHDQLRDLGRSIFCQGKPLVQGSGPWDHNYKGVPRVLRSFELRRSWFHDLGAASSGHSKKLLSEVRWLEWDAHGSDLSIWTINLHLPKLSVLNLSGSEITNDWEGWSSFIASKQLKVLVLSKCNNLRCTYHLSAFPQLKILILTCWGLEHLHSSIGKLTSLVSLNLSYCRSLKELPEEVSELKDLEELILNYTDITEIPKLIGSLRKLEKLDVGCCYSLKEIPSSVGDLHKLQHLDLSYSRIKKLPSAIGRLKNLRTFLLSCCRSLKGAIPSEIGDLPSLEILDLSDTSISDLPSVWNLSSLRRLRLSSCPNLQSLLELPSSLQHLNLRSCGQLQSLPELPSSLQHLDLGWCRKLLSLPKLPSSLQHLDLRLCQNLRLLPELPSSLQHLELMGCDKLRSLLVLSSSLQHLDLNCCSELRSLLVLPSSCQHLDLGSYSKLQSLPKLPSSLQYLNLYRCSTLQSLPELPASLQHLHLDNCYELQSLPKLPSSLQRLVLNRCSTLQSLPKLPASLQLLYLADCCKLQWLPELPSGLRYLSITCESLRLGQFSSLIHLKEFHLNLKVGDNRELSSASKLRFVEWDKLTSLSLSGLAHLGEVSIKKCSSIKKLDLLGLYHLKRLRVEHCNSLVEIRVPGDFINSVIDRGLRQPWEVIFLYDCNSIKSLICPGSRCLKKLVAVGCDNLVEIQGLHSELFLEELDITGCKSMETLPDLTGCEKLRSLRLRDCKKLTQLQGIEKLNLIDLDISGCDSLEAIPNLSRTHVFKNYEQELSFDSWSDVS